jgi:hypothetical protein
MFKVIPICLARFGFRGLVSAVGGLAAIAIAAQAGNTFGAIRTEIAVVMQLPSHLLRQVFEFANILAPRLGSVSV